MQEENRWTLAAATEFMKAYYGGPTKDLCEKTSLTDRQVKYACEKYLRLFPQLRQDTKKTGRPQNNQNTEWDDYILSEYNGRNMWPIAIKLGVHRTTIKRRIDTLLRQKAKFTHENLSMSKPDGSIKKKGHSTYVKKDGKWVLIPKESTIRERSKEYQDEKIAKQKAKERRIVELAKQRAEKEREKALIKAKAEQERLAQATLRRRAKTASTKRKVSHDTNPEKIKIKSTEGMRRVRVDRRTEVMAYSHETDAEVIARWYKNHQRKVCAIQDAPRCILVYRMNRPHGLMREMLYKPPDFPRKRLILLVFYAAFLAILSW